MGSKKDKGKVGPQETESTNVPESLSPGTTLTEDVIQRGGFVAHPTPSRPRQVRVKLQKRHFSRSNQLVRLQTRRARRRRKRRSERDLPFGWLAQSVSLEVSAKHAKQHSVQPATRSIVSPRQKEEDHSRHDGWR